LLANIAERQGGDAHRDILVKKFLTMLLSPEEGDSGAQRAGRDGTVIASRDFQFVAAPSRPVAGRLAD